MNLDAEMIYLSHPKSIDNVDITFNKILKSVFSLTF